MQTRELRASLDGALELTRRRLMDKVCLRGHNEGGRGSQLHGRSIGAHYPQQLLLCRLRLQLGLSPGILLDDQGGRGRQLWCGRTQDQLDALRILLHQHGHLVEEQLLRLIGGCR